MDATGRRTLLLLLAVAVALVAGLGIGALASRDTGSTGESESNLPSATPKERPNASCATYGAGHELLVGTSVHREPGESYDQAWQRRVSTWQVEPEIARFYYPGLPVGDWPEFGDAQVMASFKLPLVSGHADVAGLVEGRYDEQLTSWFASMPQDSKPKYVAFWHEPEDDIESGVLTETQFRQGYDHVRDLATQFDGTERNIHVGVVLMGFTANPASGRSVADFLPSRVSFVGWDVYPSASEHDTWARYARAAEAACDAGVPEWFLAETAVGGAEQSEIAQWIPMAADAARDLGYSGLVYFDSTVGGDFRLTSPETWTAINAEITHD